MAKVAPDMVEPLDQPSRAFHCRLAQSNKPAAWQANSQVLSAEYSFTICWLAPHKREPGHRDAGSAGIAGCFWLQQAATLAAMYTKIRIPHIHDAL